MSFFFFLRLSFRYPFMGGSRSLLSYRCVIVFWLGFPKCLTEKFNVKFTFVHAREASLIHPAQSNRKNPHSSHKELWCSRTGLSSKRHTSSWERFHFEPTQRSAVRDGARFPHFFSIFKLFHISALAKSSPLWCFHLKTSDRFKFISALRLWSLSVGLMLSRLKRSSLPTRSSL